MRTLLMLAWAATLAAMPALAHYAVNYDNVDAGRWACRLCPFAEQSRTGALRVGGVDSARAAPRFGRQHGIDEVGVSAQLHGRYRAQRRDGVAAAIEVRDVGGASRTAELGLAKTGRYGMGVSYRALPRSVAHRATSPFRRVDGQLRLPGDWTKAFDTGGFGDLGARAEDLRLATSRQRREAHAFWQPLSRLRLTGRYAESRRAGVVETYRDGFYQATALPQHIDHEAKTLETALQFEAAAGVVGVSYRRSQFDNAAAALVWDDPYLGGLGIGQRRSAVAPDSEMESLGVTARWRLGLRTVVNAAVGASKASQDAPLLPLTTNTAIDVGDVSDTSDIGLSFDGLRTVRHESLNLTHRVTPRLRLTLSYLADERQDGRGETRIRPVLGDLFALPPTLAKGYSFDRRRTTLNLRYRASGGTGLTAGASHRRSVRSALEISVNRERRAWLQVQRRFGRWQASGRHARARRDASPFQANTANNPLSRRYYQAVREETAWLATLRFSPPSSRVSAGIEAGYHAYGFPDTEIGLQRQRSQRGRLDIAYRSGQLDVTASYGVERAVAAIAGSSIGGAPDWRYDSDDTVATTATAVTWRDVVRDGIDLTLDYAYCNGIGAYATTFDRQHGAFAPLVSRHESLNASVAMPLGRDISFIASLYLERYRGADWALDGVAPQSIGNVLTLGRPSDNHANRVVAVAVERRL